MRQFFLQKSLQTQLIALAGTAVVLTGIIILITVSASTWGPAPLSADQAGVLRWRVLVAILLGAGLTFVGMHTAVVRLLRPLNRIRDAMWQVSQGQFDIATPNLLIKPGEPDVLGLKQTFSRMLIQLQQTTAAYEQTKQGMAQRKQTVDRLLEFSQSIQGAGKSDQILGTLGHFLQTELGLAGLTVLSFEPDTTPPVQVRVEIPPRLTAGERPVSEMETSLCPCHRQQLPKHFRRDGSPVRCSIDGSLTLGSEHSAYCLPFTMGGKIPAVAHLLLPKNSEWTEESKQLAQTYVNAAQSALISLNLLAEAEKQSMTDGLTGLYNRRSLDSLMEREVALAERHRHTLSLVMIDMDQFKQVNDTFGHAAGDHMLRSFADCVRITLRKTDLAFRYGGDEFLIALPQTPVSQAQQVVQKLRQAFAAVDFSSAIAKLEKQPTLSIGVAERSIENNVLTLSALLSAADQALYEAKNSNRNCIKVYQPVKAA